MGSGASKRKNETTVVIVGGGYAGVALAVKLRNICDVTLIDPKDCFVHNIGALRACVEPAYIPKLFISYDATFGDSFVRGKVTKISRSTNSVTLEGGREIKFTHLVIATGTTCPFPGKVTRDYPDLTKDEGIRLYEEINKDIQRADTVVCVGGGTVGVELAAEIKVDFPAKEVVLIQSNDPLCSDRLKKSTQDSLQTQIRKIGVTMMLGERVSNLAELKLGQYEKGQILKTGSNKEIKADLIFPCTGSKLNTAVFRNELDESMTERGKIKVDKYFRVKDTENIYAIGDITDIEEEKMAYTAGHHAECLAKNIKAEIRGKSAKGYKSGRIGMVVSLGRTGGVGEFNGLTMGNIPAKVLKSKDLYAMKYWEQMKQKMP